MLKPVLKRVEHLEKEVVRDLELTPDEDSRLTRLVNAMRELAKTDEKIAAVLRSFSLL